MLRAWCWQPARVRPAGLAVGERRPASVLRAAFAGRPQRRHRRDAPVHDAHRAHGGGVLAELPAGAAGAQGGDVPVALRWGGADGGRGPLGLRRGGWRSVSPSWVRAGQGSSRAREARWAGSQYFGCTAQQRRWGQEFLLGSRPRCRAGRRLSFPASGNSFVPTRDSAAALAPLLVAQRVFLPGSRGCARPPARHLRRPRALVCASNMAEFIQMGPEGRKCVPSPARRACAAFQRDPHFSAWASRPGSLRSPRIYSQSRVPRSSFANIALADALAGAPLLCEPGPPGPRRSPSSPRARLACILATGD